MFLFPYMNHAVFIYNGLHALGNNMFFYAEIVVSQCNRFKKPIRNYNGLKIEYSQGGKENVVIVMSLNEFNVCYFRLFQQSIFNGKE